MTRSFSGEAIDTDRLLELLDLARRAPSAGFSQGSHFLLLTDEALARYWDVSGSGAWFAESQPELLAASAIVIPLADPSAYTRRYSEADKVAHGLAEREAWAVPFWLTDTAMAAQNLLLLVEAQGWGALLFGLFGDPAPMLESFGVPAGLVPIGVIAIGVRSASDRPSGSPTTRPRRPAIEVVHHNRW